MDGEPGYHATLARVLVSIPLHPALLPTRDRGAALDVLPELAPTTGIGRFEKTIFFLTTAMISQLFDRAVVRGESSSTSIEAESHPGAPNTESCL